MTTTIRQMIAEEYSLLEEFLYQAIFVPQGLSHLIEVLSSCRSCSFM